MSATQLSTSEPEKSPAPALRPVRIDVRIRNEMNAIVARKSGVTTFASAGEPKLSRLRAKAKSLIRGPADMVRRFLNAPVRGTLTQLEQRIEQQELMLRALLAGHAETSQSLGTSVASLAALTQMFGARMDEFEVKMRPLVSLDDAYAVRLGDGYVLVPKDEPAFLLMLADATTGGLEPGTRACLKRLLQPGDTAVDIGANIGLLTMACARAVGFAGKVYSFEPETRMADLLQRTIAMNGLSQVKLLRQAASAEPGTLSFNVSKIPGHSSLFALPEQEAGHKQQVEVVRLDDVIPAGSRVDVVKIDVEGAEMDVLKGMQRILADNADIVVIAEFGISHLRRVGTSSADWFGAFTEHGLKAFTIEEPTGSCKPADIAKLESIESANVAFVRPGTPSAKRLIP